MANVIRAGVPFHWFGVTYAADDVINTAGWSSHALRELLTDAPVYVDSGAKVSFTSSVAKYGADPTGATVSDTAFNGAIGAANTAGGGIVFVAKGIYALTPFTVYVLSNVTLLIEPGTVFIPATNATGSLLNLATATWAEAANYSDNAGIVCIGGTFTFDFSLAPTVGGTTGQRGISVFNARHWTVQGARTNRADMGSTIHISKNGGGLAPSDGSIVRCRHENATNDSYGVTQVTAGAGLRVQDVYADRGVPLRIENDGQFGAVSDVFADGVRCVGGRAAVFLTAHNLTLSNIRVKNFYAKSCIVAGVSLSTDTGASMGDITIEDGVIEDCLGVVGPVAGGPVINTFGKNVIRNVTARRCTDSVALRNIAGFDYQDCLVEDCSGIGVQDAANQPANGISRFARCVSRRNTGPGFVHNTLSRVVHEHCEAYDDSPYQSGVGTELLTANQQGAESSLVAGDMATGGNSAVVRTTAAGTFRTGVAAYQMTSSGAGTAYIGSVAPTGTGFIPVTVGVMYVFAVWIKSALESRNCQPQVTWYNGSSTNGTSNGPVQAVDADDWTQVVWVATAPANSTGVRLLVPIQSCAAAGEVYYYDDWSVRVAAKAQTQTYGLQANAATKLLSVSSVYGPNLTGKINGSQATHTYIAPRDPQPGAGRAHLSALAGAGAVSPPASATGFVSQLIGGVERKLPYYPV